MAAPIRTSLLLALLSALAHQAGAQTDPNDCEPYVQQGAVLVCAATGPPRNQLLTATFVAGSVATGETLANAIALEVATAPFGSSSGGFTFTFDSDRRLWNRTASTFGPGFSERALTIGRRKLSAGLNAIGRRYDRFNGLDFSNFTVFRFQGGALSVSASQMELQTSTNTIAGFAHYGLFDRLDVGVAIPYVRVTVRGASRLKDQSGDELQRVNLTAAAEGVGDVAIFGKYRFWQSWRGPDVNTVRHAALAVGVTGRLPTGDREKLLGLGEGRLLVSLIGSAVAGRYSPHLNVGYEVWTNDIEMTRDFQGISTTSVKDQVVYSAGFEFAAHPRVTVIGDLLGRYLRGGGRVGYQPFFFTTNRTGVQGADALVGVPGGFHTVTLAPGIKWNFYRAALLTGHLLVSATQGGLQDRITPVVGVDWGF